MRTITLFLLAILFTAGCEKNRVNAEVTFEWFNLSTNHIWITDVTGFPKEASPGHLVPSLIENQLNAKSSTLFYPVQVESTVTIFWSETITSEQAVNLATNKVTSNKIHQFEFKREDYSIIQKLENGHFRFTYLGNDKWRITFR